MEEFIDKIGKGESIISQIFESQYHIMLDEKTRKLTKEKNIEEDIKYNEIKTILENNIRDKEERRRIIDLIFEYKELIRDEAGISNKRYYEVGFSNGVKLMADCFYVG